MMFKYTCYPVFMIVIYDIIYKRKTALGYILHVKSGMWEKTKKLILEITYTQFIATATKIKETN